MSRLLLSFSEKTALQNRGKKTRTHLHRNLRMVGRRLGESIGVREDVIKKASSLAHKAHKSCSSNKPYLLEKSRGSSEVIFAFPGSWVVDDWYSGNSFGDEKVDLNLFPYLRSIGNDEAALVNCAFFRRFEAILRASSLENEVKKAVAENKQIIFTGHSSGGSIAICATLWFLKHYTKPFCITFGSPLVGNKILAHALKRENWDKFFIHFVTRYDVIPLLMLSPFSSIEGELQQILNFLNPKKQFPGHASRFSFFTDIMRNASTVASYAACQLMGSTNQLFSSLANFIEISPYRPFGAYIVSTDNRKLVLVKNPDAVLQLLFYSCQVSVDADLEEISKMSLGQHLGYENKIRESLELQSVVFLDDHLDKVPLSSGGGCDGEVAEINLALTDLGLSTRSRLCLRAAAEQEKQKYKNQEKICSNKDEIGAKLIKVEEYRIVCENSKIGYYDAFKIQDEERDFHANIKRLELAGMWDEIIEMLKRNELPDDFEGQKDWIELGTKYRRLVEPLDIANYYRHVKNEDTGPYMIKARPKRYRYTQRWLEHAQRKKQGFSSESCVWARIEELKNSGKLFEEIKEEILVVEMDLLNRKQENQIRDDVFLKDSTFSKWWRMLPLEHRRESCLGEIMNK